MAKPSSKTSKPYQVFVSHATADKWIATTLCEKIQVAGAASFRDDRDIDGGDDIPDKIRLEIKRSQEIVVLLTPHSVDRPWVLLEVGAAWGWRRSVRITPIMCHVDVDSIPEIIKSKKAININECDAFFSAIRDRVREYNEKR
jgi:hypothetical protein